MSEIAPNIRNKTHESWHEVMEKRDKDMYEEMYLHIREPIWICANAKRSLMEEKTGSLARMCHVLKSKIQISNYDNQKAYIIL